MYFFPHSYHDTNRTASNHMNIPQGSPSCICYGTTQYLVVSGYSTPADVWSVACTVFELLTGEYLFDPKKVSKLHICVECTYNVKINTNRSLNPPDPCLVIHRTDVVHLCHSSTVEQFLCVYTYTHTHAYMQGEGNVPYDREEDLLALHQELLGDIPLSLASNGT